MSKVLHRSERCTSCGQMIDKGARADRIGVGHSAKYRHKNGLCPKGAAPAPVPAPTADRATERQVWYALHLQDSASPSERYTRDQLAAMGRAEISQWIGILQTNG